MSRVSDLTSIWRQIVGTDHHKHKDGVFFVTKVWGWDDEYFYASHDGYFGGDLFGAERKTFEEAERDLETFLVNQIRDQYKWATRVMASPEDWPEAEEILKVINANIHILKGETNG